MKRKLFWCLALTGLLTTTSCSQDETVEEPTPQPKAIGFSSFIDKLTRVEINSDNLNAFQVWAFEQPKDALSGNFILNNVKIQKASGSWNYEFPSQTAYWRPDSKYTFFGVAPSEYVNKTSTPVTESSGNNIIGVSISPDAPATPSITFLNRVGTVDLVAAINDTYASTPWTLASGTVAQMSFCHLLTRIHFAFKNSMEDGSSIQVSNVTITDSPIKGTASVTKNAVSGRTEATWLTAQGEVDPASATYSDLRFSGAVNPLNGQLAQDVFENTSGSGSFIRNGKTAQTQTLLIIPINTAALHVSFTIDHKKGDLTTKYEKKDILITMPEEGWKSGYCYQLTAEITTKNISDSEWYPITFNPTVVDWIEAGEQTLTVPETTTTPSAIRKR